MDGLRSPKMTNQTAFKTNLFTSSGAWNGMDATNGGSMGDFTKHGDWNHWESWFYPLSGWWIISPFPLVIKHGYLENIGMPSIFSWLSCEQCGLLGKYISVIHGHYHSSSMAGSNWHGSASGLWVHRCRIASTMNDLDVANMDRQVSVLHGILKR